MAISATTEQQRSVKNLLADREVKLSSNFTIHQFFGDVTFRGYFTGDEMMDYVDILRKSPSGIDYMEIFFDNIKLGLRIVSPLLTKVDKGGNNYAWVVFSNGGGTKVTLEYGMKAFVRDYQNGVIKPEFDFYDLVQEAKKLQSI